MKTVSKTFKKLVITCFMLGVLDSPFAQGLIDSLSRDESEIVSSIAPYSADMRSAILNVSQYPQALVKLERTQARTSQSFQDLISPYPRAEQEKFYQAARFPELTNQLVGSGKKSIDKVKSYLKEYPEKVQQQMLDLYTDHYDDLVKINTIYVSSQNTLQKLTAKYAVPVQEDFKKVISTPDIMNLLTDNIDITVSLGEAYKADPSGVTQQLDNLNKQLVEQNSKDLDDYKLAVQKDPKLQAQMKKAADEFAQQYDQEDTNPTYVTNNYYDNYPYQYWYGYPYWYSSPLWYPTPFYYQTGFYYGTGRAMVIVGLPSLFYANWFFRFGHARYPGLYNHYNAYYNVHRTDIINRNVYRGFNTTVRDHFGGNRKINRVKDHNPPAAGRVVHVNNPERRSGKANLSRSNNHMNQLNVRPGNFNNNGFNHYHATSFHSAGWHHVGGGRRGR